MNRQSIFWILILFCILTLNGCFTKEETERANKYQLKYIYLEEPLELKETSYTKIVTFTAKYSAKNCWIELLYLNLKDNWLEADFKKQSEIQKSLHGFSIKIYDGTKHLISSYSISEDEEPSFATSFPSFWLGSEIKINKAVKYTIKIVLPPKRGTQQEYLKPRLIVSIPQDPSL